MAVAFLASACFMIIEIVAGRLVARHFGTSIYTWTAVIGVCLAGMSIGNYLGGRLADRYPTKTLVRTLLMAAAAGCILIPIADNLLRQAIFIYKFTWPQQIAVHVAAVFLIPTILMSAVSPVATKMGLDVGLARGRTVGSVYAVNTAGAIAGTFLAGFFLIPVFGSQPTAWLAVAALGLASALFAPRAPVSLTGLAVLAALAFVANAPQPQATSIGQAIALREPPAQNVVYEDESKYSYIAVKTTDQNGIEQRHMLLDKLVHSYIAIGRPLNLIYKYEQIYAAVVRRCALNESFRALAIGGGGYVFPHYLTLVYPNAHVSVVEIDPDVTRAAFEAFGLPRDANLDIYHLDARNHVEAMVRDKRAGKNVPLFDFIFGDAFNNFSVPFHLTTRNFTESVAELLTPKGIYMVNVIDQPSRPQFLGTLLNTFKACFENVQVFSSTDVDDADNAVKGTFVVVCANRRLDLDDLRIDQNPEIPLPYHRFTAQQMEEISQLASGRLLTDDYAPVETLLSRVASTAARPVDAVLLEKAEQLADRGKINAAIDKYRQALEWNPDCYSCAISLGVLLQQTGNAADALSRFRQARDLRPDLPAPHYNFALALQQAGRHDQALAAFLKSAEVDPDYADAHGQLGEIYHHRSEHAKAEIHFRKYLETHPDNPFVLNRLATSLVHLDRPEQALALYTKALQLKPDFPNALINLGNLHKAQGRPEAARAAYEKALELRPNNPNLQTLLRQLPPAPSP
jgi:tetratricopeptide (TPR) repeat protein